RPEFAQLVHLLIRPQRREARLQVCHHRTTRILQLDVLGPRHPRLETLVHQQTPDLLERIPTDQLLDVDAAIPQRPTLLVGLGDRRLERDDALETGPDLAHALHGTAAGRGNGVDILRTHRPPRYPDSRRRNRSGADR